MQHMQASLAVSVLGLICLSRVRIAAAEDLERLTWRFKNYEASSRELLPYKAQITLECLSHSNVSWTSSTCGITPIHNNNSSSSTADITCPWPGFHEISLSAPSEQGNATVETTVHIPLSYSPYCYEWRAISEQINTSISSEALLRVWIDEPSSGEEISTKSQVLTNQFLSLGEHPLVTSTSPAMHLTITPQGFNSTCSCWVFLVEKESGRQEVPVAVMISGTDVSILGCTVRPRVYLINTEKFNSPIMITGPSVEVNTSGGMPSIYQDPQSPEIAVIVDGENNFITQDGFSTVNTFQFASLPSTIDEVAFTSSTLCALVDGQVFVHLAGNSSITMATGLLISDPQHIVGRTVPTADTEVTVDIAAVWRAEGNDVFVSSDGGFTFEQAELPSLALSVHSVGIHPTSLKLVALFGVDDLRTQFWHYSLVHQTWNSSGFSFLTKGGNLSILYFPGVFGDLLLWEEGALYYSPNSGLTTTEMELYTASDGTLIPHTWEPGVHEIRHVATGSGGQFAVLSSHNMLFYGTSGVGYAVEIQSGLLPNTMGLLVFDTIGELKIILLSGEITGAKVPTHSLALMATYPPQACPYYQWNSSVRQEVYHLDAGENAMLTERDTNTYGIIMPAFPLTYMKLWASLTPKQWKGNQISFSVSEPTLMETVVESDEHQTAVQGSTERHLTVRIRPKPHVSQQSAAVKFSVVNQNLACQHSAESVALVSFSCPPGRHIRVARPESSSGCSRFHNMKYRISKENYDPMFLGHNRTREWVDKVVEYDHTLYGCPLRVSYSKSFLPTLHLYDGEDFIKVVDADFVMWELHGRTDFRYTADAGRAKCHSTPQTWEEMLLGRLHPSQAWTPETYRHCYQEEEGGSDANKKTTYQILNSTGVNGIRWRKQNAIYIMVATVVASNYSYCNLTTIFGVQVDGKIPTTFIGYLLLVMTCMIGGGALLATYFFYRHLLASGKLDKTD